MRSIAFAAAVLCACSHEDTHAPAQASAVHTVDARISRALEPGTPAAAGDLHLARAIDGYAVLVPPRADPAAAERAIAAVVAARHLDAEVTRMGVADAGFRVEDLRWFARKLGDADVEALGHVETAIVVRASAPPARAREMIHGTAAAARAGATAVDGWIHDEITRETFTRASFDERRPGEFPLDVETLVVEHLVADADSTVFLESFGMIRFGLPEIYMRGIPRTFAEDANELANAAAQTLAERGTIGRDGELSVDIAKLREDAWPAKHAALEAAHAPGKVTFTVTWSRGDRADDRNAPLELELGLAGGVTPEKLRAAIVGFFGDRPDEMKYARGDDTELRAATDRARKALALLGPHFSKGIPELERLMVKAPFTTDQGGVEWMWVEVQSWTGTRMTGILVNRPDHVSSLREGARVEVLQGDIFDYVHIHADGTQAGGETESILERR
jgi:uncharacterized protein YegJ (DUF2314 family)